MTAARKTPGSSCLCGRTGAALPLALLVLVVLSGLAGAAVLRATTQMAAGLAQRDALEALHLAEGALHAWTAAQRTPPVPGEHDWPADGPPQVRLRVERLARPEPGAAHGTSSLFAVHSDPVAGPGGRSVVALLRAWEEQIPRWISAPDAALVHGAGAWLASPLPEEAVVRDGRDHPTCTAPDSRATHAVLRPAGAATELRGGATVEGALGDASMDARTLVLTLFDGIHTRDVGWNTDLRFGRFFGEAPFPSGAAVSTDEANERLRWGCPGGVIAALPTAFQGGPLPCALDADTSHYALVAIDAEGGVVRLDRGHAQGLIVVVGGDLHLGGDFVFRGVIAVDGDATVDGGRSTWGPSVEGAVIATGAVRIGSTRAGEGRILRFDRCAVERVRQRFEAREGGEWGRPRILGRPHGWVEVLR